MQWDLYAKRDSIEKPLLSFFSLTIGGKTDELTINGDGWTKTEEKKEKAQDLVTLGKFETNLNGDNTQKRM